MTPGDLVITVEFTTEPDEKTAFLSGLYANGGVIKPNFARDNYDYTIAVPFGTEGFSISAQAENPYLEPELRQLSPESGDKELDDELTLTEGLNEYTITVTSQDTKTTQTYNIKVVKLPDLSLADFKITAGMDFEQYLPPFDTQTVYVPYANGITVAAEVTDSGAGVNISPPNISGLQVAVSTAVTVTVSKTLPNVEASLTSKDYILNLYYGDGVPLNSLADGGYISFVPGNNGANSYDEVHTFLAGNTSAGGQAEHSLIFKDGPHPATVQVLVAAGGGGGGMSSDDPANFRAPGGGGAGGYIYVPSYAISENSITVKVGAGGIKAIPDDRPSPGWTVKDAYIGGKGGDSEFGSIKAPGGGGGASHYHQRYNDGLPGGSGGGGTSVSGVGGSVENGAISSPGDTPMGNVGGGKGAGGGGGAGGTGADGISGAGTTSSISGQAVTYACGGNAGAGAGIDGAANTGNGGSGGTGAGGKGGSGIVIVRFPHTGVPAE